MIPLASLRSDEWTAWSEHVDDFIGPRKALQAGVKIASRADFGPVAELGRVEIEQMVNAGMTEMQALVAATRTSTDLCGMGDHLGTVEKGKLADLMVLSANPLQDSTAIRNLKMVFKGGNRIDTNPPEGQVDLRMLFF